MARTPRFRVANLDAWGSLVKSWATGHDYVTLGYDKHPPRQTPANLTLTQPLKSPLPTTTTEAKDNTGTPRSWCLPPVGAPVDVPAQGGGTLPLPFAVAMSVAEFKQRLLDAGVNVTEMPAALTKVVIVQGGGDTMVFRLPPRDTLQGSEDDLLDGVGYDMPDFYDALYSTVAGATPSPVFPDVTANKSGLMKLHANRIGEYTLNNCS